MLTVERIKSILEENSLTISVAESCTGGSLQNLLTSIDGASNYFIGGICAYNIDQKVDHLGVNRQDAEKVNCISQEIADQMAIGCSNMFKTDISISTTGYISKYLYYSIFLNGELVFGEMLETDYVSHRSTVQRVASLRILETFLRYLESEYSPSTII